jgi:hypothetical protein
MRSRVQIIFTLEQYHILTAEQATALQKDKKSINKLIFFIFMAGLSWLVTFLLMSLILYFQRCQDSNPESCRSKQARHQLSHPSL